MNTWEDNIKISLKLLGLGAWTGIDFLNNLIFGLHKRRRISWLVDWRRAWSYTLVDRAWSASETTWVSSNKRLCGTVIWTPHLFRISTTWSGQIRGEIYGVERNQPHPPSFASKNYVGTVFRGWKSNYGCNATSPQSTNWRVPWGWRGLFPRGFQTNQN